MNDLQAIIQHLRAARMELKADNDAADFVEQQRKRYAKQQKSHAERCDCEAYAFPHRRGGGLCCEEGTAAEAKDCLVSYHHTRQAMADAGHKESDFN